MKISYLGHSSFRLCSDGGTSIVTDPYGKIGLPFPRVFADAITVSHGHYDHCNVQAVEGDWTVFNHEGRFSIGDVEIRAIERSHDNFQGKQRGKNLVFLFFMDGLTICHLGDIGESFTPELASLLKPVDVLMIPVGGNYTIDAAEAKKYLDGIQAKIVIPMHFYTPGLEIDISGVEEFLSYFNHIEKAGSEISIEKEQLGRDVKVIYMDRMA